MFLKHCACRIIQFVAPSASFPKMVLSFAEFSRIPIQVIRNNLRHKGHLHDLSLLVESSSLSTLNNISCFQAFIFFAFRQGESEAPVEVNVISQH